MQASIMAKYAIGEGGWGKDSSKEVINFNSIQSSVQPDPGGQVEGQASDGPIALTPSLGSGTEVFKSESGFHVAHYRLDR